MKKKKKRTKVRKERQPVPGLKGPIDPYTGEVEPPAEGAYKVEKVESTAPGNRQGENFLINEEDAFDKLALDANADEISRQMKSFTDDEEIKEAPRPAPPRAPRRTTRPSRRSPPPRDPRDGAPPPPQASRARPGRSPRGWPAPRTPRTAGCTARTRRGSS